MKLRAKITGAEYTPRNEAESDALVESGYYEQIKEQPPAVGAPHNRQQNKRDKRAKD